MLILSPSTITKLFSIEKSRRPIITRKSAIAPIARLAAVWAIVESMFLITLVPWSTALAKSKIKNVFVCVLALRISSIWMVCLGLISRDLLLWSSFNSNGNEILSIVQCSSSTQTPFGSLSRVLQVLRTVFLALKIWFTKADALRP